MFRSWSSQYQSSFSGADIIAVSSNCSCPSCCSLPQLALADKKNCSPDSGWTAALHEKVLQIIFHSAWGMRHTFDPATQLSWRWKTTFLRMCLKLSKSCDTVFDTPFPNCYCVVVVPGFLRICLFRVSHDITVYPISQYVINILL